MKEIEGEMKISEIKNAKHPDTLIPSISRIVLYSSFMTAEL
jgi:hypothetical protein